MNNSSFKAHIGEPNASNNMGVLVSTNNMGVLVSTHNVGVLITNNTAMFELGCALELFALPRPEFEPWYSTKVISFAGSTHDATGGVTVSAEHVDNLSQFNTIVIPSWPVAERASDALIDALVLFYESGGRVISFCSGAFLLAQTGLLNGKQGITHWRYASVFKQQFPKINYVDDVLYTLNDKLGCSAGSSAAIDLGIAIIRHDYGYNIANQVARRLVLAAHRNGGQSQFVETPVPKTSNTFSATLDWAIHHIDQTIDVNDLAKQANMSRRSFDRHFRSALNMSPKEWITQQRLQRAKTLLETTRLNIDQVAYQSGFESAKVSCDFIHL